MSSPILLTGGTGTLGRLVAPMLREAGHEVRVLSRRARDDADGLVFVEGDLASGKGIAAAVQGVRTIVHCAGSPKGDAVKARILVGAALGGGASHIVYISVVGADRIPVVSRADRAMFGYYAAKLASERLVADSGVPWTTLRATQFHDLLLTTAQGMAKMPVVPVPSGFRFQPIDPAEVAARLVELAQGRPAGLVAEMGGPRTYSMKELVRSYLEATHRHRLTMPMRMPGKAARAFRAGANLVPQQAVGRRTWEEFLAERTGARRTTVSGLA